MREEKKTSKLNSELAKGEILGITSEDVDGVDGKDASS